MEAKPTGRTGEKTEPQAAPQAEPQATPRPAPKPTTLSSRIFRVILLIVLVVVVLCGALMAWALYDAVTDKEQYALRNSLYFIEQGLPQSSQTADRTAYITSLGSEEIRVTWIAQDGAVLYDSRTPDPSTMDNHADREEVVEAKTSGEGQSIRYSDTFFEVTYYHALRLDDGTILRLSASRASALSGLQDLVIPGILAIIGIVLAAVLIAQWIARRTIAPLNEIDLDAPLQGDAYTEFEPLLTRINEQRRQIEQQAKAVEESRRTFIANASHELKTPLTVISGYAELLKDDLVAPEDLKQISTLIFEEAGYMQGLVDDILVLSRLDEYTATGDTSDHAAPVDLARISADVLLRLSPFAEQSDVSTALTCIGDMRIMGIEKIIAGIIYNLCENAIRYNRPGGSMTIEISETDDGVSLAVTDTGIGIAPEDQSRVFERFYRVDKTHSRETGGTGLGLAIVKHGAFYHRANITLESTPNEGTTITLHFPRA
jgi:two-component system phosphate regulon sensor histidine kinase PhoR